MAQAVSVDGLAELNRAFARADRQVKAEFKQTLVHAAQPVADDASRLALTEISNMRQSVEWAGMRVGVARSIVYVAPKKRSRTKSRGRPNLFDLILGRSLEPALEQNIDGITGEVEEMLNGIAGDWGRL